MKIKTKCQACNHAARWQRNYKTDKPEQFCENIECLQGGQYYTIGILPKVQILK